MSLDRSPSPQEGGGWSSPGLTTPVDGRGVIARGSSPAKKEYGDLVNGDSRSHVTWASAQARSARVRGQPSYESKNSGFFMRHMRRMSSGLPYFTDRGSYAEKEKLGRGRRWSKIAWSDLPRHIGLLISRRRKYVAVLLMLLLMILLVTNKTVQYWYRRTSWLGGGSKFVIILGANPGGGVMEWKGPREWAIERDSVKNKKRYAAEWGYEMEIVDMSTKKRYAHEWRESWEKVDVVRNAMRKYPDAEWFWWLDLNTFIMEPHRSLQSHIFNNLGDTTYRDINAYNPLNIAHPPNGTSTDTGHKHINYLDPEAMSAIGDGEPESINIIVPQDCGGFNLGSFFVRRSSWTDRLLDIWWDPVFYEQRHMEWEHKEQDALEYIYTNQPWIRPHFAFIPQRSINAFPDKACGDDRHVPEAGCASIRLDDPHIDKTECGLQGIHYQESERDFLVNMAGCEWGRDCWGEMYNFRQLSNRLNRNAWEKVKDGISDWFKRRKEAKQQQQAQNQAQAPQGQ